MSGWVSGRLASGSWRARSALAVAAAAGGLACASTASAAGPNSYLSVFAGTGTINVPVPGGPATSSSLYNPDGVAVNPTTGDVYIADYNNNVVEEVTPNGTLSIFAGSPGHPGTPTSGVAATSTDLGGPAAVAVDPTTGDVYIADYDDNEVDEVDTSGTIHVIAGTGTNGAPTPGPATSSDLANPYGVAVDPSTGNVYIGDYNNNDVEEVTPAGTLTVIAGQGPNTAGPPTPGPAASSDLDAPAGLAVDSAGNLYIADSYNNDIEKVTPAGTLSVVAGKGPSNPGTPTPGPAAASALHRPTGVAVDSAGDLYVSDNGNNEIDEITAGGILSIFAGNGAAGPPTTGLATASDLDGPFGVAVNTASNVVYIADREDQYVEQVGQWPAAVNNTPPSISGTAQQGKTLTAAPGTWSHITSGYSYQWEDCNSSGAGCTAISGATGSTYKLVASDVGHRIRVVVTASNPDGGATGTSAATQAVVAAPSPSPSPSPSPGKSCAAATGKLSGTHLGPLTLGMTRAKARKALSKHTVTHKLDRFCLTGGTAIFAGYPSNALLKTVSGHERKQLRGRVVVVLTSSRHYSVEHITAGTRVAKVRKRLAHARTYRKGGTTWYVLSGGKATRLLEVKHGKVTDVGIAAKALTGTRAAQRRLLSSL